MLDLGGYDREALAGLTGACRFDGGVERQQVGLGRNAGDHVNNAVDAAGGFGQFMDDGSGSVGLGHGLTRLLRRVLNLTADFLHGSPQFLGRTGDRGDIGPGFFGGGGHRGRLCRSFLRRRGQLRGGRLHFGSGRGHALDNAANGGFELVGQVVHGLFALDFRVFTGLRRFGFERLIADHAVLEDFNGLGHVADFVLFAQAGNSDLCIAAGQFAHHVRHPVDRHGDAADQRKADGKTDSGGNSQRNQDQADGVIT